MRSGWVVWVVWAVWAVWCGLVGCAWDQVGKCQRTPLGTHASRTPGDNGYKIKISADPVEYVPGEVYTVSLEGWRTQYSVQKFTGFMLVVEASASPVSIYGPRSVGTFQLYGDALTMHSDSCPNAVIQTSSISKSEIQVLWTAPPQGSGCVVFRATVVENRDQWYMDDGELTKELCEEVRENDDMQPEVIYDCCACDEAKYEVTFEGMWSRHTHPKDFPTNEWLTHFSDIIGASHSANYRVWNYGEFSSDGLRQVAEWGSTRSLESELKSKSDHIRTIIKARGLWYPNVDGKTFAVFRVDNRHHLMSLVSMLGPSPDWIVGVSALELCLRNCSWVDQKTLNLYPWDAGTDSGVTYESANSPTIPKEKIRRITNSYPKDPKSPFYDPTGLPMKPLAKLTITRQRVYEKSCSDTASVGGPLFENSFDEDVKRPECKVNSWTRWSQCSVSCGKGLRSRTRTYLMPMKASMHECRRQMEEKEMCAAADPICPDGTADSIFGDGDIFPSFDQSVCETTDWSPWTPCSATCGKGHRMRNRRFLDRMGRKKCQKKTTEKQMCVADVLECDGEEIPPECSVHQWSDWSPCSVTCGEGSMSRTRQYLFPSSNQINCAVRTLDRQTCFGERRNCTIEPSEREEVCKQEREAGPCRGYFRRWYFDAGSRTCKEFSYGGCRGNRNNFENYDECVLVCAMSKLTHEPINRLSSHPGSLSHEAAEKVDCMVTEWTPWGPCSATCGKARKTKSRMIKVRPQNGGKRCPKKLLKKKRCNNLPDCDIFNGLVSESLRREEPFETYNPEVSRSSRYESYDEYSAPALFNPPPLEDLTAEHDRDSIYSHGITVEEPYDDGTKVDCMMGEWGPWSPCTHSCGSEALQQRSRKVLAHPRNGGIPCGDRYERRYCTLPPCRPSRG